MTDQWQYWRDELANPGGHSRDEDRNISGFYRMDGARTKPSYPVAIWREEGQEATIFQIGRKRPQNSDADNQEWHEFIGNGWTKCVAVTREEWNKALDTGFWSDGKHSRQMDETEKLGIDTATGGNNAPAEESLADQISTLAEKIDGTPEPTTQDQANTLSGLLDKMRALLRLAEAERVKQKEPHLQASRAVDSAWTAIKTPGEQAGIAGEARRKAYLKKVQAKLDADAAAERKRQQDQIDAENESIRAAAADLGLEQGSAFVPEKVAPVIEAPRATAGSAYGRASGLKKITVVDAVDQAVLTKHFIDTNDQDFANYLTDRAKKAIRAKITLPGVTTREEYQ